MSLINAPKGTVAVIFSVLLTVLAGCFFPALGAGVAQSFEISSLASIAIPKQTQSAHTHGQIVAANAGRGLGDYLREDGTLDLVSGLHGSLDARGYRLASGPTETPRFERVSATGDEGWADGFGLRGIDGKVYALAVDGSGNLYAGGEFTVAGAILANNIAKWNGSSWEALGTGIDHSVYALAVDGSGNLYAGGKFYRAGGVSVHHIAKWNGASWEALGTGMDDQVNALAIDGQGNIYAGGLFSTAGGVAAPDIAKWNGSSWKAVGSGMRGYVFALAVDGSDNLYAGGGFSTAGGVSVNNIAKWNGSSWEALGSGIQGTTDRVGAAYALAVDGSGNVYAGGYFKTAGGVSANNIAKWNGSSWEALGSGMEGEVRDLALDGNGNLYAGGYFTKAGGVDAKHVAKWDGSSWEALWTGINNNVSALTVDSNGNLYAGGKFSKAGGVTVNSIAVWYGGEWSAIYAGDGNGINGDVKALALDGNGNLYAGGDFTTAGGVSARRIAKWNGSSWEALGSGMGFSQKGANAYVAALAADSSGNVYAGGEFNEAGGVTARSIAKWNGSSWEALGSGVGVGGLHPVTALAVDGSGNVYAGGQFTTAGGVSAKNIAKWNGSSWEALGSGIEGPYYQYNLYALAVDGSGNLYAGGHFNKAGGVSANNIAKWNGSSWEALGSGTNYYYVAALAVDGSGNVYAGGQFFNAGGISAKNIAKWNGSSWEALGSGTNSFSYVYALAADRNGCLYAGGSFTTAGGKVSLDIARWAEALPSGSLKVSLAPKAAAAAGARWKVDSGVWTKNGATMSGLPAGTYTVVFKTIPGWIRPAKQSVTIVDGETALATGTYQALKADFAGSPTSGKPGLKAHFADQSSGPVKSWSWDFGDNSTSRVQNPVHIYRKPGTYTVKLTIKNGSCTSTESKVDYIRIYPVPKADFNATPTIGTAPLSVQFTDLTDQSAGPVTSWLWRFGDTTTSSEQNPSHIYTKAGTYSVKLRVKGPGGSNTKNRTGYITIKSTQGGELCPLDALEEIPAPMKEERR